MPQPEGSEMTFFLEFCRSLLEKVKFSQNWKLKGDLLWFMDFLDLEPERSRQSHRRTMLCLVGGQMIRRD